VVKKLLRWIACQRPGRNHEEQRSSDCKAYSSMPTWYQTTWDISCHGSELTQDWQVQLFARTEQIHLHAAVKGSEETQVRALPPLETYFNALQKSAPLHGASKWKKGTSTQQQCRAAHSTTSQNTSQSTTVYPVAVWRGHQCERS
jgi:hypothetical protein